jgi:hypothetical protein
MERILPDLKEEKKMPTISKDRISNDNLIKAHAAIAILMGRRETWSLITYGDLGKRINHDPYLLTHILNAVGAWCRSRGKLSLVLTLVTEKGEPGDGMFPPRSKATRENYLERRIRLYRDDSWKSEPLPTLEQIAEAYNKDFAHEQN